jgi:hypothetical protein
VTQSQQSRLPCPLCGRITRAHSRIEIEDLAGDGGGRNTSFATVICRDCAFAMVVRSVAADERWKFSPT